MSVTIKEVARAAGVSIATVSRVLNAKGSVSAEVRQRTLAAAARLRYVPHGGARSLVTSRTRTIGVILPDLFGEFFSELIRGTDRAARARGYHLLVSGAHHGTAELADALRMTRGLVDGLVVMSPAVSPGALEQNLPRDLPVVLVNCGVADLPSLRIDNVGGAQRAVDHLLQLGHRRIAYVGGPADNVDAAERLRGYRAALRRHHVTREAALEFAGDFTEDSGHRAGRQILALTRPPDAVFAANDAMAIGVLSAVRSAGLAVPEDIALVGFDDIPLARFMSPPLTSVHVPIFELGVQAMERLIDLLTGTVKRARRQQMLPTTLQVRTSCGAPATAGRNPGTKRGRPASQARTRRRS